MTEITSPSTRNNDLNYKRSLYRTEGVGIYVIVDLQQQHVDVNQLDSDGQYDTREKVESIDVSVCEDCRFKLDFTELFD